MNISMRLGALAALPACAFAALAVMQCWSHFDLAERANAELEFSKIAARAGDVLHASQRERGMSTAWLGGGGEDRLVKLEKLRDDTDARLAGLEAQMRASEKVLDAPLPVGFVEAVTQSETILAMRTRVSSKDATVNDAYCCYTAWHKSILDAYEGLAGTGDFVRLTRAYGALLRGKEYLGAHRAIGSATFARNRFEPVALARFIQTMSLSDAYLDQFCRTGSHELAEALRGAAKSPPAQRVVELRQLATEKASVGGFDVAADDWWDSITAWVDAIKETEDVCSANLLASSQETYETARAQGYYYAAISLLLLLVTGAAVWKLAASMVRRVGRLRAGISSLAAGDLTMQVDAGQGDEIDTMSADFDRSVAALSDTLGQIQSSADEIESESREIAEAGPMLAQCAQTQAASLEEIRASLLDLGGFSSEISSQAALVGESAEKASKLGNDGRMATTRMATAMERIHESGEAVSLILRTIEELAFQTNLLALNAAVEAARAGEAGRGFAVVAEEVRMLALRSASSAEEVGKRLAESGDRTRTGLEVCKEVQELLCGIETASTEVSQSLAKVVEGTRQQDASLSLIGTSVSSLDGVTQTNAENSEELAGAMVAVNEQICAMRTMVGKFRVGAVTSPAGLATQEAVQSAAPDCAAPGCEAEALDR